MTNTYIALANITLATATSSVTFGSIPQTYRDLVLVLNGSHSTTGNVSLRLNTDSGANYFRVTMAADGGGRFSFTESSRTSLPIGYWESGRSILNCSVMDYSATDKHKSTLSRSGVGGAYVLATAGRWTNTAAITSLQALSDGNFAIGTVFSLYGIRS